MVYSLFGSIHRYSELKQQIDRVTQKILIQTLRKLERDGLILRKVFAVIPSMVEYPLTPLGRTSIKIWVRLVSGLKFIAQYMKMSVKITTLNQVIGKEMDILFQIQISE